LRSHAFDLYGRYSHVWSVRQESLPAQRLRILDVGDPFGTISALFADDFTVSVDLYSDHPAADTNHHHVEGNGLSLPFADGSFDLVCSHDTLEHLPADLRTTFLAELLRVSSGPVVVVAPFGDPRSHRAERIVNAYFVARLGHTIPALDEHEECVLPDAESILMWLDEHDIAHRRFGDGWLYHWIALYFLRAHLVSLGATREVRRIDIACNDLLVEPDHAPPHYRTTLVLRPPPILPALPEHVENDAADTAAEVEVLTELALSLGEALVPGEDALAETSRFRTWVAARSTDASPAMARLAASLTTLLDAVASAPGDVSDFAGDTDARVTPARSVALIVVHEGASDVLAACLRALEQQSYPADSMEAIVVDLDPTGLSGEMVRRDFPGVRVQIEPPEKEAAAAITAAAGATSSECIVLLDSTISAPADWVAELLRAYRPDAGVVCVAAPIAATAGGSGGFAAVGMNFHGAPASDLGSGAPFGAQDGDAVLYANRRAMLVSRQVYLVSGGFDGEFHSEGDDVDFGWRLWVLGYQVRFAAGAGVTDVGRAERTTGNARLRRAEASWLRALLKNYGDDELDRVLGPALLLLLKRAALAREAGGGDARLLAAGDVLDNLDQVFIHRRQIQRARRRDDADIFSLLGTPFAPVLDDPEYADAQGRAINAFGLEGAFERQRARRVLFVLARDSDAAGLPAQRTIELVRVLSARAEVSLAIAGGPVAGGGGLGAGLGGVTVAECPDEAALMRVAEASDVVVVGGDVLCRHPRLASAPAVLVVDLVDPWMLDPAAGPGDDGGRAPLHQNVTALAELLDAGDFFICASEHQRDYWLGMLSTRAPLDAVASAMGPTLRDLVDVVPFGTPSHPAGAPRTVLRGVNPAIADEDLLVVWAGGTSAWGNPVALVEAWLAVVERVPAARLYFPGFDGAGGAVSRAVEQAVARAEQLGLAEKSVLFGPAASDETRAALLSECDVAVCTPVDSPATRLAARSDVLDCVAAGAPLVTTSSDLLADVVRERGLGAVIAPGDVSGLSAALVALLQDPARRAVSAARAGAVADEHKWERGVAPLQRVVRDPWRWRRARAVRAARLAGQDVQAMLDVRDAEIARLQDQSELVASLRRQVDELEGTVARHFRSATRRTRSAVSLARRLVRRLQNL